MPLRPLAALLVSTAFVLAACGSDGGASPSSTSVATTAAGAGGGATITIADFAFSPPQLTVKAGATVEVRNTQGVAHTVTADDGSFNESVDADGTATLTLPEAGSFPYHCTIHPTMTGTIVAEA